MAEITSSLGTVGCDEYSVYINVRGGGTFVGELTCSKVSWRRVLDDTSEASVEGTVGIGCCDLLSGLRPWRHEVSICRGDDEVWVGPLFSMATPAEQFKLVARDLSAWWDHRFVHSDHDYSLTPTDLATIFQALSDDAMLPDNSPGLFVTTTPCGVLGTNQVLAAQNYLAGTQLRDLANTGIDWTVVQRDVLAGGLVVPTRSIGIFLDQHFVVPPTVNRDGSVQANSVVVAGAGTGAACVAVSATASDAALGYSDGLLETLDSVSTIADVTSAQAAADSQLALLSEIISVDQATLVPGAPFPVSVLVPGARCRLELAETCIPVSGLYRLQSVQVDSTRDAETVAVTFQPAGTRA